MARHKKKSSFNKDAWLNTYADMITLVLVFFILLYSMSTMDQQKYEKLVKAFTADPATIEKIKEIEAKEQADSAKSKTDKGENKGGKASDVENLDDLYNYLNAYVNNNQLSESVQVEKGKNLVYIRFSSSLFFEPDKAVLKQEGLDILSNIAPAMSSVEPNIKSIRIDGHTAEAAQGTSIVDNRQLSTERANAVLKFFENTYIKDPSKLLAVGYGMYRPVAPNDTEANRAKNRRVEILVTKVDNIQDEIDKIYDSIDKKANANNN